MNLKEIKKQSMLYERLKNNQAGPGEYFFAFSDEQFTRGEKKIREISPEKIYKSTAGLFGTRKGLDEFYAHYDGVEKSIQEQCPPLGIFYYEYYNHEGDYGDDEAWDITRGYFPDFDFTVKKNANIVSAIKKEWAKRCNW